MRPIKDHHKRSPVNHERDSDRLDTRLPLEIDGIQGLTRNLSATGIYFETQLVQEPGSRVHVTVEVDFRGEKLKLVCEGEVVRVEYHPGGLGIAARLENSFFSDTA